MSNVTPMFLAHLDGRIMDTSLSATGGNCRVGLNWDLMNKSSVLSPFNFYVSDGIQRYPINRFECVSPPRTESKKKNQLHINETPFHVDVLLCHPAERYITDKGAVPKQIPVKPPKATSVEEYNRSQNHSPFSITGTYEPTTEMLPTSMTSQLGWLWHRTSIVIATSRIQTPLIKSGIFFFHASLRSLHKLRSQL